MKGTKLSKINWEEVRDEYVAGSESLAQIAKRLGVSKRAVEQHAAASANLRNPYGGKTWGELRAKHRASVSQRLTEDLVAAQAEAAVETQRRHIETLAWLAELSRENIADALKRCAPKEKLRFGLAIIAMERRVHGLDRVQLEVSGKDGRPIEHDISLDESTRELAERALEAIFGEAAQTEARPALRVVS
jgi:predicted DNA-binding protein YlxM (UPF0122 family)